MLVSAHAPILNAQFNMSVWTIVMTRDEPSIVGFAYGATLPVKNGVGVED